MASPSTPTGLVYWFESGAINESIMSDVFGEFIDKSEG